MGPLNDENNLQVDKNDNKNLKKLKNVIHFQTVRYKLTASGNSIQSILNYKLMRLVSVLRLLKEKNRLTQ